MGTESFFGDMGRLSLAGSSSGVTLSSAKSKETYLATAKKILGSDFELPIAGGDGIVSQKYGLLTDSQIEELMGCFVGIALCEKKVERVEEALLWLEEVEILYLNARIARQGKLYDWDDWFPDNVGISVQYARAHATSSDIFLSLGNTATAVNKRWTAHNMIPESHEQKEPGIPRNILHRGATQVLLQFRHPDPALVHKGRVNHASLQVLGSWKKLKMKKAGGPGNRMSFSAFIWDGRLYVAGGRKDSLGPFYRDIFSLDLSKPTNGWKVLQPYPQPRSRTSAFIGWSMVVCPEHKRAYLFTGRPEIDYFDLTTQTWGSMMTKFVHGGQSDTKAGIKNWPYPKSQLTDSAQQIANEKLYVFGGTHGDTNIGCNLFMVLDLKTRQWKRLSGYVMPPRHSDPMCPGPRKTPNTWVDNASDKLYLINGECDRMGASLSREMHGGDCGHPYDDFWSWDIKEGKWRRERMVGNTPCPRSEAACVYNPKLNKTVVWGGYHPDQPTEVVDTAISFSFSYFADTFIYDGPPTSISSSTTRRSWKQVLTKGFPTYRAQSQLLVDPQTGRTYLFGGFTNNDYIPSRKTVVSRSFGDLWELRVDMPGGHFEGVDVEDEGRTAQMGPWQRCFACGSAGPWRKCGGSCRGRAFFCDPECLKEGWKDHKKSHGCQKLE